MFLLYVEGSDVEEHTPMSVRAKTHAERATHSKKALLPFITYLLLFFSAWTGWVLWIYPWMQSLGDTTFAYTLLNIVLRMLIWVLPVFLYLRFIDHVHPLEYLKLTRYWQRGVLVGLAVSLVNFLGTLLRFGPPHLSSQYITWNSVLSTSILIGFIEEIPFRGFIFQKLGAIYPFWVANLLSSWLFVGIHLPGWITRHLLISADVVTIFLIGVVLAAVFYYAKSLWSSIIAHSLNDFFSVVLFYAP
jgi:membrane protease YdiL (CAAX protease family)